MSPNLDLASPKIFGLLIMTQCHKMNFMKSICYQVNLNRCFEHQKDNVLNSLS